MSRLGYGWGMKLIEKLANEVYEESGHDPGEYQGFLKGFRKARQMASLWIAMNSRTECDCELGIKKLGEWEVE